MKKKKIFIAEAGVYHIENTSIVKKLIDTVASKAGMNQLTKWFASKLEKKVHENEKFAKKYKVKIFLRRITNEKNVMRSVILFCLRSIKLYNRSKFIYRWRLYSII